MTVLAGRLDFMPMAIASGAGVDMFNVPFAVIVIGGLLASTFLRLILLPMLYAFESHNL